MPTKCLKFELQAEYTWIYTNEFRSVCVVQTHFVRHTVMCYWPSVRLRCTKSERVTPWRLWDELSARVHAYRGLLLHTKFHISTDWIDRWEKDHSAHSADSLGISSGLASLINIQSCQAYRHNNTRTHHLLCPDWTSIPQLSAHGQWSLWPCRVSLETSRRLWYQGSWSWGWMSKQK